MLAKLKQIQAWAAYAKKAVIGLSTAVLGIVAVVAPSYSTEAGVVVATIIAVLGAIAQFQVTNAAKPKRSF